jgi:hypothetical protein
MQGGSQQSGLSAGRQASALRNFGSAGGFQISAAQRQAALQAASQQSVALTAAQQQAALQTALQQTNAVLAALQQQGASQSQIDRATAVQLQLTNLLAALQNANALNQIQAAQATLGR